MIGVHIGNDHKRLKNILKELEKETSAKWSNEKYPLDIFLDLDLSMEDLKYLCFKDYLKLFAVL